MRKKMFNATFAIFLVSYVIYAGFLHISNIAYQKEFQKISVDHCLILHKQISYVKDKSKIINFITEQPRHFGLIVAKKDSARVLENLSKIGFNPMISKIEHEKDVEYIRRTYHLENPVLISYWEKSNCDKVVNLSFAQIKVALE